MAGNEVEQNLDALGVGAFKEPHQILVGTVTGSDLFVIAHVVAGVHKRRVVNGIEPERVAAQLLNIVELLDDTLQIADTVAVAVVKALWIDFVKYRVIQPSRHKNHPFSNKILYTFIVSNKAAFGNRFSKKNHLRGQVFQRSAATPAGARVLTRKAGGSRSRRCRWARAAICSSRWERQRGTKPSRARCATGFAASEI